MTRLRKGVVAQQIGLSKAIFNKREAIKKRESRFVKTVIKTNFADEVLDNVFCAVSPQLGFLWYAEYKDRSFPKSEIRKTR